MAWRARPRVQSVQVGLTLVELLAALAILALLAGIGAPGLNTVLHRTLTQSETSRLLSAIQLARSEAIKRNLPVSLCPSTLSSGGPPDCEGVYNGGWVVFANPDRDSSVDPERDTVIGVYAGLPRRYRLTNRTGTRDIAGLITYLPDGTARRALTLTVCSPIWPDVAARSIVLSRVGRPRTAVDWGECP